MHRQCPVMTEQCWLHWQNVVISDQVYVIRRYLSVTGGRSHKCTLLFVDKPDAACSALACVSR